jgi:hypothetical protein
MGQSAITRYKLFSVIEQFICHVINGKTWIV